MMQYSKPYSFEKTDVRGRFLLKFSCTNVKLETVSPIAANVSAMSSGGFGTTHYQNTTNDNRKHGFTK